MDSVLERDFKTKAALGYSVIEQDRAASRPANAQRPTPFLPFLPSVQQPIPFAAIAKVCSFLLPLCSAQSPLRRLYNYVFLDVPFGHFLDTVWTLFGHFWATF